MRRRIVVIKLGALGDVIMATAAIRRVQQGHPQDELWLLTAAPFAAIFNAWPGLNVHVVPRHGVLSTLKTIAWLRSQGFERVYDLQSNDRTALLCALSGIPERVGNHPRYPYTHHPRNPHPAGIHGFERLQQVLAAAGLPPVEARPFLPLSDVERDKVAAWIAEQELREGAFVIMHAGASGRWPAKRWPYFRDLAEQLATRALPTVWIGAAADAAINRELARHGGIDATHRFNAGELAELGRHARFAVTNDSGPMHILSASGVPVYAFFGPTDWRRSHAIGQGSRVLFNPAPCTACRRADRAVARDHSCLPGIPAAAVIGRLTDDGLI